MMQGLNRRWAWAVATGLLLAGCGENQALLRFGRRMTEMKTVSYAVAVPGWPTVNLGRAEQQDLLANAVASVTAGVTAGAVNERIRKVVKPNDIRDRLTGQLQSDVPGFVELQGVDGPADASLQVVVQSYGIVAEGPAAPLYAMVEASAELLDNRDGSSLWSTRVVLNEPLSNGQVWGDDVAVFVGQGFNVLALAALKDEQLAALFHGLMHATGSQVVQSLATSRRQAMAYFREQQAKAAKAEAAKAK